MAYMKMQIKLTVAGWFSGEVAWSICCWKLLNDVVMSLRDDVNI